jgi:hypothetical protein
VSDHITISKENRLPESQDYHFLRSEGVKWIEKLGSKLWTDYNLHDPGITILETLCYAITDLSYRSSFRVQDLLAEEKPEWFNGDEQTFFTAREILTTAPWTINDYRKLLIDLEGIGNAWIGCRKCYCGPEIYVDCKKSELTYTKPAPPENPEEHKVVPKGMYDVLLELETTERFGDLNTGKVSLAYTLIIDGSPQTLYMQIRFPSRRRLAVLGKTNPDFSFLRDKRTRLKTINAKVISNNKAAIGDLAQTIFPGALRGGLYCSFEILVDEFVTDPLNATPRVLELKDVPFRFVYLKSEIRKKLTVSTVRSILEDNGEAAAGWQYLRKVHEAEAAVGEAGKALQKHRNITEDFCCIEEVEIEEIGVCADIEVTPDADIEKVLSEAFYRIEEYFDPTIRFHTLSEMLEEVRVEEIFNGPKLKHGFVMDADLEKTALNRTLYSSDVINEIMDIPGVVSLRNFALVRFDKEGNNIGSDPWKLEVKANHLSKFYLEGSKFLVFKNGLPFHPDIPELIDTMQVVRGRNMMPKLKDHELDLPIPMGVYSDLSEYQPVQNSLPLVYGTGPDGLPSTANDLRRMQAKQLKAYLTFFDQLLVNYLAQLSNLKDLFSIRDTKHASFSTLLGKEIISRSAYGDIVADPNNVIPDNVYFNQVFYDSLDASTLQAITESEASYLERRNRFLDHLLARFGESFSEYALLLFSYKNQKTVNSRRLINIKADFLKQFSYQSAFRAQGFDQTDTVDGCIKMDISGLHHRISVLLGLNPSRNFFEYEIGQSDSGYAATLCLNNDEGKTLLEITGKLEAEDRNDVIRQINFFVAKLSRLASDQTQYKVSNSSGKFLVSFGNPVIATCPTLSGTQADAEAVVTAIVNFAKQHLEDDSFTIVEHILLRPRKNGDALLPVCVDPDCHFCGDEDPYSYRLTFVFDGETDLAKDHFDFRKFAEKTIRAELPAHVLVKVCWVEHDVYVSFNDAFCNWIAAAPDHKSGRLSILIDEFRKLKSIYPPPTLHDCIDGNDENRVFLNQTQL